MTLKELRIALDLSQNELDRRAGVPRGTTHDLESGRNSDPSTSISLAIVRALQESGAKGVDVETIFAERTA